MSGFSIISTVGGNGGYDKRQAYVQVKDPRGFVIEITDENFIEICKNFCVNKGVLDGEYVYAFDDKYASLCLVNVLDKVCGEYKQNTIEYYFLVIFLIKIKFSVIIYKKKNIVFPDIADFDDLYTKSLEEFSIKEKPDNLLALYSYIKNAKMTYRVSISDKLVGFRLRSLNRFVYKINKLI